MRLHEGGKFRTGVVHAPDLGPVGCDVHAIAVDGRIDLRPEPDVRDGNAIPETEVQIPLMFGEDRFNDVEALGNEPNRPGSRLIAARKTCGMLHLCQTARVLERVDVTPDQVDDLPRLVAIVSFGREQYVPARKLTEHLEDHRRLGDHLASRIDHHRESSLRVDC